MTDLPRIQPRGPITAQLAAIQQMLRRLQPASSAGTRTSYTTMGTKREAAPGRRTSETTDTTPRWG